MTLLDTPEGRKAVEAMNAVFCRDCRDGKPMSDIPEVHGTDEDDYTPCRAREPLVRELLTAALPFIRKAIEVERESRHIADGSVIAGSKQEQSQRPLAGATEERGRCPACGALSV